MNFKEEKLKSELVYEGKVISLYLDKVSLPDGNVADREIIKHSGGSAVYCENDGKVLMVKQFRYAYGEELYEIPAGKINKGETPLEAARRELEEEGGIKAKDFSLLYTVYPTPGYTDEKIYIFKAENLVKTRQNLDKDEFLTAEWIPLEKLKEMVKDNRIKDGKTIIALLSAR